MKTKGPGFWICSALLAFLAIFIFLPLAASPTLPGAVLRCLPLGWWRFLERNTSQMTWNWGLIATGLICSAVLIAMGNTLLRALFHHLQQASHPNPPVRRWCCRWTICAYAAVWLLFSIAFGSAGLLRHTTWLMNDPHPWYEARMNSYIDLRMLDLELHELVLESDQDLPATRTAFHAQPSYRRHQTLMADEFDVLFYGDKSNKVAAYVMIPRKPQSLVSGRFALSLPGTNGLIRPISALPQTIAELDAAYPPALR